MALFSFRMKDGNTVIIYAQDERSADELLREMGPQSAVANVRQIATFAATFSLTDSGDLQTTLLHPGTLKELAPQYPFLQAAKAHSYADFGSSRTDDPSKPVLFNQSAREHKKGWNQRDKEVISYAVQQERERFSN
ncbi:MAG TPA: hypothetical protein VJT08_12170 [Terriglobales bacterium]|nr:hypothetical protein [Terriglobales bacterium]